jgi:acyl carrier protein
MIDTFAIAQRLRAYIADTFLTESQLEAFGDDTDLLLLLDSLQFLKLVIALEPMCGVKVSDGELNPENLGSVRKIAAFVAAAQTAEPLMASHAG